MPIHDFPLHDPRRARIGERLASHWQALLAQGLLLEVLGLVAFAMPLIGTLAVTLLVGGLLFAGGLARVAGLLHARHWPGFWWSLGAAILAALIGLSLIVHPLVGMLTLTVVLAVVFFVEGVASILAGLDFRHHARNWGWLLVSGLVDLLLVYLIWWGWPGSAIWAVGVLVGANLFTTGLALMLVALTLRSGRRI